MTDIIGNVKMNLQFYTGEDSYNDGDIEDEILQLVKTTANNPLEIAKVLAQDSRWPVLYHLSSQRLNLLDWYSFDPNGRVLEIGAGCGALTGLLCEKTQQVIAVELSKRRAEIIGNRHRNQKNLEVVVGNLNDIQLQQQFDYVTLIGVLEYAGKFTTSSSPFHQFLLKIKEFIEDDGTLIIAIENKYGLKYWAGAREDHTGRIFDSLENYRSHEQDLGVATFSNHELRNLLTETGFKDIEFYYPMPDYKMPVAIYTDDFSPSPGSFAPNTDSYDQDRFLLFNEERTAKGITETGQFGFFANSFLVFCKKGEAE
ncbi:class I SAM-dependent methyltransferase [Paenibacillus beijingensis]|uniref:Methyltransferase type 12 n=1 Tax=Paenibacillus beijingensis TaxID=1126833 RepID=A0A0D5NI53_9BACL|nr:methyltransferase [Paenibacillus beijingensis]AJY74603.1 methyltransferase type 12 [Paenibacillus beijingensis]